MKVDFSVLLPAAAHGLSKSGAHAQRRMSASRTQVIFFAGMLSLFASTAAAMRYDQLYIEAIKRDSSITPVAVDSFGDQIDLGSGGVTFQWTDIDVPGNSALPVRLQRRLAVADRYNTGGGLGGFNDLSDIDLPHIKGTYGNGQWLVTGDSPESRCTYIANGRPTFSGGVLRSSDYWGGDWLHIPWAGTHALLTRLDGRLPKPPGAVAMTRDFWAIKCLGSTKNGYGGEGFLAVSPHGEKYYFDWVVVGPSRGLTKRYNNYAHATASMQRADVYFLVSRIEDRFGNWVTYSYSGRQLTDIRSSDGRFIHLDWAGSNVSAVTSTAGAWSYSYPAGGITLKRPDASLWSMVTTGALRIDPMEALPVYAPGRRCPAPEWGSGNFGVSVTQPSGGAAKYTFNIQRHYENNIPEMCNSFIDEALMTYRFLEIPNFSDTFTLVQKEVYGPGVVPMVWSYSYGGGGPLAFEEMCANPPTIYACPPNKYAEVRGPGQSYKKYVYGNLFGINSGQILEVSEGADTGTSSEPNISISRATKYTLASNDEAASQVFPADVGSAGLWRLDSIKTSALRPAVLTETTQDGVTYRRSVPTGCNGGSAYCFDVFARPLKQVTAHD